MSKPIHKSRTNRTVAGIVGVVVARAIVAKVPFLAPVADVLTDEVTGAIVAGLGALAVHFRQAANPVVDQQTVVTPRPDHAA